MTALITLIYTLNQLHLKLKCQVITKLIFLSHLTSFDLCFKNVIKPHVTELEKGTYQTNPQYRVFRSHKPKTGRLWVRYGF